MSTTPDELEMRQRVVQEARSWIGTPYHHRAQVKGAGVDCAMLPYAVYRALGLMGEEEFGNYPTEWHLHHDEERYLAIVGAHAREIEAAEVGPGDFVIWKFGRAFSHGGIVTAWPRVVHSYIGIGVSEEDVGRSGLFRMKNGEPRPMRAFSLWRTR